MGILPYNSAKDTPRKRRPLDQEQVVREALRLLDDVGLNALTMRNLAARLSVRAASLYRHVRDKQELLILLADELSAQVPLPSPGLPWREQLIAIAKHYRRALLSHRDGPRLLALAPPAGERRLLLIESVLREFAAAGFSRSDAARAAYHFNNFVTEFAADEMRIKNAAITMGVSERVVWKKARKQFAELPKDVYPTLVTHCAELTEGDFGALFQYGLDVWLDGLEKRLSTTA